MVEHGAGRIRIAHGDHDYQLRLKRLQDLLTTPTLTPAVRLAKSGRVGKRRGAGGPKNWVAEACDRLGGVLQAAADAKVTLRTMYEYKRQGYVHVLAAGVRLAKATGISVEKFAPPDVQAE